jgi:tetratricopeptide (TPR) repeat protein
MLKTICTLLAIVSVAACPTIGMAHDSPEHVIEELTEKLAKSKTAELYTRRAAEYRQLRKFKEADADLQEALKLEPGFLPALSEVCRVYRAQQKYAETIKIADDVLSTHKDPAIQAHFLALRADANIARGEHARALADLELALKHAPTDVDLILTCSTMHGRLDMKAERVKALAAAFERTQAAVLEIEWIEALIANGEFATALTRIEPQLAASRLTSSWLLRRARCYYSLGRRDTAREDATKAVTEITTRIDTARPDPSLLADRALAHAILADAKAATDDLQAARKLNADPESLRRVEQWLKQIEAPVP